MAHAGRRSAIPAKAQTFSAEFDIVITGAGGVGLATACFSAWLGNKVLVLEKADQIGGTTSKAAFWYWVPNNEPMRAMGIVDKREDCLRYMARLSRPEVYNADHPTLGMSQWEYDACAAIYDNASAATELLAKKGALEYRHCPGVPDYWAEIAEDKAPTGRVLASTKSLIFCKASWYLFLFVLNHSLLLFSESSFKNLSVGLCLLLFFISVSRPGLFRFGFIQFQRFFLLYIWHIPFLALLVSDLIHMSPFSFLPFKPFIRAIRNIVGIKAFQRITVRRYVIINYFLVRFTIIQRGGGIVGKF